MTSQHLMRLIATSVHGFLECRQYLDPNPWAVCTKHLLAILIYQFVDSSLYLFSRPSVYEATYLSLSICLAIYLLICLLICLSICLASYLSIFLSTFSTTNVFTFSLCLSVDLRLCFYICLFIYLSHCMPNM